MAEKFDICVATTLRTPSERPSLLAKFAGAAAPVIAYPVWRMDVRGTEVVEREWDGGPIEVADEGVVCLYPKARSSSYGAWLIEVIGEREVWTLSLPNFLVDSNMSAVTEVMWKLSTDAIACISGREYSMGAIYRLGDDVEEEAATSTSLASHAVLRRGQNLAGWSILRTDSNRVLLSRGSRSR